LRALILIVLIAYWGGDARAQQVLLPEEARLDFQVRSVPIPATRYGAVALHDYDRLPGERPHAVEPLPAPPSGWPNRSLAGLEGSRSGPSELAGQADGERCRCATVIGNPGRERVAALYVTAEFAVGTELLEKYQLLQLKARYRDGLVIYVNGRELARRNISAERQAAHRLRGPEWEHFVWPIAVAGLRKGKNLIAVEVRPAGSREVPHFAMELSALQEGGVARGPMVQRVSERSATVVFDTDLPRKAKVEYGLDASLGKVALSAGGAFARHHKVRLAGLEPGASVYYRTAVGPHLSPIYRFHTPPASSEPLRFAVYGDMRGGHSTHAKIVAGLLSESLDMVLATGDLVLRGSDEADWQRFFSVTGELLARVPYYPVAGNHDLGKTGDERRRIGEIFDLWPWPANRPSWGTWYSFDVSGVHFLMLDSNSYEHEEQLRWVEEDLKKARASGARAIFAAVHDGPYSRGLHRGNRFAAEHYAPLLSRYGVTMLFSGHDHLYQRGEVDGLPYIVSGGAGAPLYSIRCGVSGRRKCSREDGMLKAERAHHYVLVTVFPKFVSVCPKRVDGTEIEPCITLPSNSAR
jgi:hypothetical protein